MTRFHAALDEPGDPRLWSISETELADTLASTRDAKRRLGLAHALDHDHEPVRDAMAAGHVSKDQPAVIVKGVDALPVEHRR